MYIYEYVYFEEYIFRQQVIIQASFVKDDGRLFIILQFYFFLVIFLVSGSKW